MVGDYHNKYLKYSVKYKMSYDYFQIKLTYFDWLHRQKNWFSILILDSDKFNLNITSMADTFASVKQPQKTTQDYSGCHSYCRNIITFYLKR